MPKKKGGLVTKVFRNGITTEGNAGHSKKKRSKDKSRKSDKGRRKRFRGRRGNWGKGFDERGIGMKSGMLKQLKKKMVGGAERLVCNR